MDYIRKRTEAATSIPSFHISDLQEITFQKQYITCKSVKQLEWLFLSMQGDTEEMVTFFAGLIVRSI